jgi:hypothetical protein
VFNIYLKLGDGKIVGDLEEIKEDDVDESNGEQIWICKFCNHRSSVDLEEEKIPKKDPTINWKLRKILS